MAPHVTTRGSFGPGTFVDDEFHGVPDDSRRLLSHLVDITPNIGFSIADLEAVDFTGQDLPIIPGPLKSQVMICSLKGQDAGRITIDTDACGLFPGTAGIVNIDGKPLNEVDNLTRVGADLGKDSVDLSPLTYRTWSMYPTKDPHVYYQLLSSLAPLKFLAAYGIDPNTPVGSRDEAYDLIGATVSKFSAPELEARDMDHGFCGQTCYTPQAWRETNIGKRLAAHPLINWKPVLGSSNLPVTPFPESDDHRPLAGIKVLELARVIAGPAMGAMLAALGADVIKVQSPNLPDLQPLCLTLTAGKRTYALDLTKPEDDKRLRDLMDGADVVIQAFRYRSLERKGLGLDYAADLAQKRGKGIVYLDLNTYGPDGYYAERPGYQQIADAASGCSYVTGRSLRKEGEAPVLPPLPVSDMLSGALGVLEVLLSLRDRATHGGSYHAFTALTAVDTIQLSEEVGLYSQETVDKIQDTYQFGPMGTEMHPEELLYAVMKGWANGKFLERPGYLSTFKTAWGEKHSILAPIIKFDNPEVCPRWDHGPVPYCNSNNEVWN